MNEVKHNGAIESDFLNPEYQASCSCGWHGNVWDTQEAADKELGDHYAQIEREAG